MSARAALLLLALVAAGCRDQDELCTQVTDLEVCWGRRLGRATTRWRERPAASTASRFRAWACAGEVCRQRWPRLPDDGHWECVDLDGAVVCRGGEPPAGAHPGPAAAGWLCGASTPRVCVDLAPEMPEGAVRGWRCAFEHQPDERRVCVRDPGAPGLGRACADGKCPPGTSCADGRCLPSRPAPSCWLDQDCKRGRCELGSCVPRPQIAVSSTGPRRPTIETTAARLVSPPEDLAQVGFDAPFQIDVARAHPDAAAARIEWRQRSGPPLALSFDDQGFRVRGRTPPLRVVHPDPIEPGLVSFSPRTRGEAVLEALVRCAGHPDERFEVRVGATARSSPVPSIAVGHDVYLGGPGWQLRSSPAGTASKLEVAGELTRLRPDRRGRFVLADGNGHTLSLRVGRYDETPLDCGRGDCHPRTTQAAAASPMTNVLHRGFEGALAGETPRCAIACHAVGEPGIADGGYADVARQIGFVAADARRWADVPAPLRALGGVGCTTCHGPGAIPEPGARTAILASDVCAVCHDAPPRYGHVSAWRASKMARAPRDPAQRALPCAGCHDTAGFLAAIGARPFAASDRQEGIGCAACHAVHDAQSGPHLLRVTFPLPSSVAEAPLAPEARLCVRCHTPEPGRGGPSQAALWLGRGAVEPASGRARTAPGAHAALPRGCIACHAAGPAVERGAGHGWQVDRARCTASCHQDGPAVEKLATGAASIAARARALWARHGVAGERPPHAQPPSGAATDARQRALDNLRLVIEDGAAAYHNAAYARAILDEAERLLR